MQARAGQAPTADGVLEVDVPIAAACEVVDALPWLLGSLAESWRRQPEDEPALDTLLAKLAPVDLVLIEGYKRDAHPKIEAFRAETKNPLIATDDPTVKAIASDTPLDMDRPVFDLNDTVAIADFILSEVGLA